MVESRSRTLRLSRCWKRRPDYQQNFLASNQQIGMGRNFADGARRIFGSMLLLEMIASDAKPAFLLRAVRGIFLTRLTSGSRD